MCLSSYHSLKCFAKTTPTDGVCLHIKFTEIGHVKREQSYITYRKYDITKFNYNALLFHSDSCNICNILPGHRIFKNRKQNM